MKKIITIDGLSASGKSSLSRNLAKKLGWRWLSTGVIYRGLAYISHKERLTEAESLSFISSGNWEVRLSPSKTAFIYKGENITEKIYEEKTDERASFFSANKAFRKALIPFQRGFFDPKSEKGLILEGRDCGSVIFPDAPLKVFLEAGENQRAERRARERSQKKGQILKAQKERDKRDRGRDFAPALRPKGSILLNSESQGPEEIADIVYSEAQKRFSPQTAKK